MPRLPSRSPASRSLAPRARRLLFAFLASLALTTSAVVAARELVLVATVDESQVVRPEPFRPPRRGTGSPGTGGARLVVDTETGEYVFDMEIEGLSPVLIDNSLGANNTGVHVHSGEEHDRGPFIIDVHHHARELLPETNGVTPTASGFRLHAEGTIDRLQGALDVGVSREEIIATLANEATFVAVHTTTNELFRTGAIRGNFERIDESVRFVRADCNGDINIDVADALCILYPLFLAPGAVPPPPCLAAADVNRSGDANIADASYLLNFLFLGGPAPGAPFPDCGSPSIDVDLACDSEPEMCRAE